MQDLLASVREALALVPEAGPFLAEWPEQVVTRVLEPVELPVCRWLAGLGGIAGKVREAGLHWRQTYGAADFGEDFLQGYAWAEFLGTRGPVASARIACGVLVLAPGIVYPAHAHEAEEVYLPVHGVAEWMQGDWGFAHVPVGQGIYHAPWVPHAMRVGAEPLVALYLWRGGDLAAKSVILDRPLTGPR